MDQQGILIFDVETTGTDKRRDQVIEICLQIGLGGSAQSRTWRCLPTVPISPGAQAVHGISMDDLRGCPPFAEVAEEIRKAFASARILVGYNLSFDIDMVQAEYARLKAPPLDLSDKLIVDPFRLWQQCEPRTLQDAHRRFVGGDFASAHSASADVAATGRVLEGMIEHFDLGRDWDAVASVCEPERARWIGTSKHIQWSEAGLPMVTFGKHAGASLSQLASGPDSGYLRWIIERDFPEHVRELCRRALDLDADDFQQWVESTYGPPPADESRREPGAVATREQQSALALS